MSEFVVFSDAQSPQPGSQATPSPRVQVFSYSFSNLEPSDTAQTFHFMFQHLAKMLVPLSNNYRGTA